MQAPAHPIPSCLLQGICAHLGVPFAGGCHSLQDPTAPRGRTRWPGGHQGLAPRFRMLQAQGPGVSNDCCSAWKEQHRKSSVGLPATKMLPSAPGGCQGTAGPGEGLHCPFSFSTHIQAAAELSPRSLLVPGISTQSFPPAPAVPASSHTRTSTPSTPSGKTPSPGTARPGQECPALPPCLRKGVEGGDGAGRKREQTLAPQTSKSSSAGAFGTV